jgi:predicted nucleic acid-binding protein
MKHYLVDTNVIIDMLLDREDAVQNFSASANPLITGIITRNQKDFRNSKLEILDSRFFLQ